ncbi:MAG TPA: PKD domain-containing protein [Acidimicrobiales bacterium]|nr:PKD domain-containing protein [Acidimicrobiales bacterium]
MGAAVTAGPATPAGASTCVAYDQTSATTPVTVSATPTPIAPAGSLAAGQSVVVTVTGYDSSGSCVSGGPVWLYFDGPGTAVPPVSPAAGSGCSSLESNGSLGPNYSPCYTDANGEVLVTFTTPTPLPTGTESTVGASTENSNYTLSQVATTYSYPSCDLYSNGATVTSLVFSPAPIAPTGALSAGQYVTVDAAAYDQAGNCVTGAPVDVTFTGAGTASAGTPAALGSYPQQVSTNSVGAVDITYKAADPLPNGTTDTLTAWSAASPTDTPSATDRYTYGTLTAQGVGTIDGAEGQGFSGPVAYFSTTSASAPSFSAAVDWGDGTTSGGTVVSVGNGSYEVTGSHTWGDENPAQTVTVTVAQSNGPTVTAASTAVVADAPITASGGWTLQGHFRRQGTWSLAFFADPCPEGFSSYTATVDWGDGTAPSAGSFFVNGAGGYGVQGSHTYQRKGDYTVTVTVTDDGGSSASTTDTAVITH